MHSGIMALAPRNMTFLFIVKYLLVQAINHYCVGYKGLVLFADHNANDLFIGFLHTITGQAANIVNRIFHAF